MAVLSKFFVCCMFKILSDVISPVMYAVQSKIQASDTPKNLVAYVVGRCTSNSKVVSLIPGNTLTDKRLLILYAL